MAQNRVIPDTNNLKVAIVAAALDLAQSAISDLDDERTGADKLEERLSFFEQAYERIYKTARSSKDLVTPSSPAPSGPKSSAVSRARALGI